MLTINMLISWKFDEGEVIERILWLGKNEDKAFVINVNLNNCPYIRRISEIIEALNNGRAIELAFDKYIRIVNEDELTKKEKEGREKAWELVEPLVYKEPDIFIPNKRSKLIVNLLKTRDTNEKTIYNYLKRYWIRGKTKNALIPDLYRCGNRNKDKGESNVKRGRPRNLSNGIGINITEDIKKIFRASIKKYYYNAAQYSLKLTYELMLKEFFVESVKYENGLRIPLIKAYSDIPTYYQFYYWYRKEKDIKKEVTSRISPKRYEQQYRAIIGNSTAEAIGPGSIFQIDATVADVYLCSRINRQWIVGRPIVYVLIDVFSRMIVGIYCGFEGPSWAGAMNALANCVTDKVKFCEEYEIEITEEQWPVHYLPEGIVADRGEMEGKNAENIIEGLGIKILNTPPYRADWKGIVEQNFRLSNIKIKPFMPGAVTGSNNFRERGDKDNRLNAKLDIYQFTQIIIRCILHHNNQHYLKNYHKDVGMIEDEIPLIPNELWKWGIANRAGKLRTMQEDIVKLHLMPAAEATVTAKGIRFEGIYYASKVCLKERWFEKARRGTWKVNIAYDPRNMDLIYIKYDDEKTYDKCFILEYQTTYKNKSIEEIKFMMEEERLHKIDIAEKEIQGKVELISQIEDIVKNAEGINKKRITSEESNTKKIKGIREKRSIEKAMNRKREAFELNKEEIKKSGEVIPLKNGSNIEDDNNENMDLLLNLQKEAMKKIYE